MIEQAIPIQVIWEEEFFMIICPECKMRFAYIAIFPRDDGFGKIHYEGMHQIHCGFCPYCGYNMKETNETK